MSHCGGVNIPCVISLSYYQYCLCFSQLQSASTSTSQYISTAAMFLAVISALQIRDADDDDDDDDDKHTVFMSQAGSDSVI